MKTVKRTQSKKSAAGSTGVTEQGLEILAEIRSPEDVGKLSVHELQLLAEECRQRIIQTTSQNGGHLASNLGIVELTLALAHEFHFQSVERPYGDRVVFDVGHQAYTWKLITGRADSFDTLRLQSGLAGFPKREESPYDYFNTGHSSTSISATLGFQRADRLQGISRHNIAIIGDGALTGGMAYEALNDAGQSGEPVLVIINDNQMSIDENVGGLSLYLEKLRLSNGYRSIKKKVKQSFVRKGRWGRGWFYRFLKRTQSTLRSLNREKASFFEDLGFRYYGPVDGHDFQSLIRHLQTIKEISRPVVLHVLTQKGRGYAYAEHDPAHYHGVSPFEVEEGVCPKKSTLPQIPIHKSWTQTVGELLCQQAAQDPSICAITAAMRSGTGLEAFARQFPERFYDTGITEQHAVTLAAGLCASGMKPFVALYSTFSQRAVDQILHDVCLQNLPVCFLLDHAGLVSQDGETHQGLYDLSILSGLPNLKILSPADQEDLKACLTEAVRSKQPLVIRYPKATISNSLPISLPRELDKPRLVQKGSHCVVFALGTMTEIVQKTAERLKKERGWCPTLYSCVNSRFIFEDDYSLEIKEKKKVLVIEESVQSPFSTGTELSILKRCPEAICSTIFVKNPLAGQASRSQRLIDEGLDSDGIYERLVAIETE